MCTEAYLEPSRTSMVELLCKKKTLLYCRRLGSKYPSGLGFTVERFTECQYLFDMA